MLFSQNPSGQVECYTDEGIFVGVMGNNEFDTKPQDKSQEQLLADAMNAYIDKINKRKKVQE